MLGQAQISVTSIFEWSFDDWNEGIKDWLGDVLTILKCNGFNEDLMMEMFQVNGEGLDMI